MVVDTKTQGEFSYSVDDESFRECTPEKQEQILRECEELLARFLKNREKAAERSSVFDMKKSG